MVSALVCVVLAAGLPQAPSQPSRAGAAFIPTSDAVDMARAIARDEGFPVENRTRFYVDTLDSGSRPRLDGFVSVAVYENDHIVLEMSINERTGQIVDATRCLSFEFPDVARFSARIQKASGARPLTHSELANVCGCDLKRERIPQPSNKGRQANE